MDTQQVQVYGLMAIAEEHQKTVKAVIDGLAQDRATLAKERSDAAKDAQQMAEMAVKVSKDSSEAIITLQKAVKEAVSVSVNDSHG